MIVTFENIEHVEEKNKTLLKALLEDIAQFNEISPAKIKLSWQDYHDDEIDYYGTYKLLDDNNGSLTLELDINELDHVLCGFNGLIDYLISKL